MIKYLGSKRRLVPLICELASAVGGVRTAVDLFSGTSRVGHALKKLGLRVLSNDHNAYAATIAACYVQADLEDVFHKASRLIAELNAVRGTPGYFTETFCVQSRFFHPENGERVDAIRDRIECLSLDPDVRAVALVSLMEAADRVDSTTGVQMAYLKKWAPRAHNRLELRVPEVLPRSRWGKGAATQFDAVEAAGKLDGDFVYIDPPYNQHKYLANYHIWETLVLWDRPQHYGVACKRIDCRERGSAFNSRPRIRDALRRVIAATQGRVIVVSFSNEGYISQEEMIELLSAKGKVQVVAVDSKRYVGAQIGIYNPKGDKVGEVSHLRNTEYLFVVSADGIDLKGRESSAMCGKEQLQLF